MSSLFHPDKDPLEERTEVREAREAREGLLLASRIYLAHWSRNTSPFRKKAGEHSVVGAVVRHVREEARELAPVDPLEVKAWNAALRGTTPSGVPLERLLDKEER